MVKPNNRVYLSSPHMSGEEQKYIKEAFDTNWIAPLGQHVDAFEAETAAYAGVKGAVALSSGTAALHLALRLLGVGEEVVRGREGRPAFSLHRSKSAGHSGKAKGEHKETVFFIQAGDP